MKNRPYFTVLILIFYLLFFAAFSSALEAGQIQPQAAKDKANKLLEEVIAEKKLRQKKNKSKNNYDPVWQAIRQQQLDTQEPFTLAELIDIALRNNPLTRQAWENTRAQRAIEKQAVSKLYPQVSVSGKITREKVVASDPTHNTNDFHFGPAVNITYLLLDFGGRKAGIEATFQGILAADAQYDQAVQDLLLNVEKSYYGFYSAQAGLKAAQLDVENAKADFDAAQQKFDTGLVAKLEVLQARSNYEDALYNLEEAKGQVKRAKAGLAQVIGFPADTQFEIVSLDKPVPMDIDEEDITQIIEEALEKRPDIVFQRAQLRAIQAQAKEATSDLLPSLNFAGSGSRNEYKYYDELRRREHNHEYAAYVSLDWNIFDGFYNLNKKRQADSEAKIALEQLIQAEIALSSEVWIKYYDFKTAVSKLKYSESFFATAQTSYELALESYKAGLKSILDLLQAQSQLSEARSRLIQSKEDVFIALAELAHSRGLLNVDSEINQTNKFVQGGLRND